MIRTLPGAQWLGEFLYETPGSWLYRRPTTDWLNESRLVSQLPHTYRFFARYCASQGKRTWGAESLLLLVMFHRRLTGAEDLVPFSIDDFKIYVDLQDPRFLRIPSELREIEGLLSHFLHPGDTFLDVGANHGSYSVIAADLVGADGMVVSFEPQLRLAWALSKSLSAAGAPFQLHRLACGDSSGEATLHIPLASSGGGTLYPAASKSRSKSEVVPVCRIDDVVNWRTNPGELLMKIDAEGSEVTVLRGAAALIGGARPTILIEINPESLAAGGESAASLLEFLIRLGYDRYVTRGDWVLERPLQVDIAEHDIIALHRDCHRKPC